ncbi:hypothetical protein GCM10023094_34170 [Rhodococcus olei]|uniref:VIT family protein n=1 Tax=Rhodococcus olei TaxID=2161675 RepID=A0ABP8P7E0_9NOCA
MTRWRPSRRVPMLPLVLGMTDGLANSLILAGAAIMGQGSTVTFELALRVGAVAFVTAAFSVFVADYAERRQRLVHVSAHLHARRRPRLADTDLGRQARRQSLAAMAVASTASLAASALPLVLGAVIPGSAWVVFALAVGAMTALGAWLGVLVEGNVFRWAVVLGLSGIAVSAIGVELRIT